FTGQYNDQSLPDRLQLRARSYDPMQRRFTSVDPVPAADGSPNHSAYAYANNDPKNLSDPSGACPMCIGAGIGAVFGGGIYALTHQGDFSWRDFAIATGKGAVIGAGAAFLAPAGAGLATSLGLSGGRALAVSALTNAAVGAAYTWAINTAQCLPTTPADLLLGAAGGSAPSLLGPAWRWGKGLFGRTATVPSTGSAAVALSPQYAFRSLRIGEGSSASLVRPGANANMQPWQHIAYGTASESPWISLTRDSRVAVGRYSTNSAGFIAVDLNRVHGEVVQVWHHVDVPPHVLDLMGIDVAGTALRDMEVLVKFRLPTDPIVGFWPAGTPRWKILEDLDWPHGH
ncbi:RHS repeat-associated core domain-containing protein, partial [Streptomyces sp. ISL-43]|uniref:RHS repeat-associated core domain-containing protein n=1 Tax=Streptomyces sp. ISL-43 TaxID=2819183 RepID=UPI001BE64C27